MTSPQLYQRGDPFMRIARHYWRWSRWYSKEPQSHSTFNPLWFKFLFTEIKHFNIFFFRSSYMKCGLKCYWFLWAIKLSTSHFLICFPQLVVTHFEKWTKATLRSKRIKVKINRSHHIIYLKTWIILYTL